MAETPGMVSRTREWWDVHRLDDSKEARDGSGPLFRAVIEIDRAPEAYALYRVKGEWGPDGISANELEVKEAIATSPGATRELWRYIFGIDLVARIKGFGLTADHPLFTMLAEPARLRLHVNDGLWLRIVDVEGALTARSYDADGELDFELADDICRWNAGRWRLAVRAGHASMERSEREPSLRLGVAELSALYLGGLTVSELVGAGRIEASSAEAARAAGRLFRTDLAPRCAEIF